MNKRLLFRSFYFVAIAFLVAYIFTLVSGQFALAGWFLMPGLFSVAIAFQGNKLLKGFSFTLTILAVVSLALYYPQYFIRVGGFKLSGLIVPLLQVIMFGMGTELSLKDFAQVCGCREA